MSETLIARTRFRSVGVAAERRVGRSGRLSLLAILILVLATASTVHSDSRGVHQVTVHDTEGHEVVLYEQSHALVIGVSNYDSGWPDLPGVRSDVRRVVEALEEHGFDVALLENPNRQGLDRALREFVAAKGQREHDRLLIYFAGHGYTVKKPVEMGYIVPADAPNPAQDLAGFEFAALSMGEMQIHAQKIKSKHALFLFDSCFAGSIFGLSRADVPKHISSRTAEPVRFFITSGSVDEEVPDESVFRRQLVTALEGEGDTNGDGYLTGTELGEFLFDNVVNFSTTRPQYGKIKIPELARGDFVFSLPGRHAEASRRETALATVRGNLGSEVITGTMYDQIFRALGPERPPALRQELLAEIEALDGSLQSQRSFAFYFERNRARLLASLKPSAPTDDRGAEEVPETRPPATSSDTEPVRGDPRAPVTIVEFADFQCPYCSRAANTVEQILEKYGDDVKHVFRHFPLRTHRWARSAAIAAHCAGQQNPAAFWILHDQYYQNQKQLNPGNLLAKSKEYLAGSSIDLTLWSRCSQDEHSSGYKAAAAAVDADVALGQKLGVSGTPSFFINGELLRGAKPITAFEPLIEKHKG